VIWAAVSLAAAWAGTTTLVEPGQPIPDRPFDIEHLDLEVRLDLQAATVRGVVTLHGHRRSAGPLRLHQRDLTIHRVTVDGVDVAHRVRSDRLLVPVPADRSDVEVAVHYSATPRAGLYFRGLDDAPRGEALVAYSQGEDMDHRHWFPSFDHPSDRFTVATHLEVPPGYGAWAVGHSTGTEPTDDGWVRHSFRLDREIPNYLVAVAAGAYDEVPQGDTPVPTSMLLPAGADQDVWQAVVEPTPELIRWLSEALDEPFPYPSYRSVVVPRFLYGGMENPGFVALADSIAPSLPDHDLRAAHRVVAHEVAHQWFGDLVTTYGWRHLWLNEGLATYWAARWLEREEGPSLYAARVRRWHRRSLRSDAPVAPLLGRHDGDDYAKVYVQGASLVHFLDVVLGRDTLERGLQVYLDRHRDEHVESSDLRRVLEDVSGRSLGPWFTHFLHREGHASLSSSWAYDDAEGALEVAIEQPASDGPTTILPVEVAVAHADGTVVRQTLQVAEGRTAWALSADGAPRWVAVDPRGAVLAHFHREQPVAAWAAQAVEADEPFARLEALHQLGQLADDEASIEVLATVLSDPSRPSSERAQAADALGHVPMERAVEALLAATNDADRWVTRAVFDALGRQGDRVEASDLTGPLRPRQSERATLALDALSRVEPAEASPIARSWLRRPDPTERGLLHATALTALGREDAPRHLSAVLSRVDSSQPYPVARAALQAGASLAASLPGDHADRRRFLDRAEALVASRDLRLVSDALRALAAAGTPSTARHLDDHARTLPRWGSLREAATAAAEALRRGPDAEGQTDQEALDALEQRLDDLLERVERLERY